MFFDRFDVCEAWLQWAHDWGEYEVVSRLQRLGFKPSPLRGSYEQLEDNARLIYWELQGRSMADPDWFKRKSLARRVDAQVRKWESEVEFAPHCNGCASHGAIVAHYDSCPDAE